MYNYFSPKSITPKGWIYNQLKLQANGLCGNLDKVWPDVRDSAWIGGDREGWERVPYWLDGFIPLAYLLNDADMKARADKYINAIVKNQQSDGWICPTYNRADYDMWALFLIGKVLALYCEFTGSRKVKNVLYDAMKNGYEMFKTNRVTIGYWGGFRWFECVIPLTYLYKTKKEQWICDFARLLCDIGADWQNYESNWTTPLNRDDPQTHIVNIGMMLKYEAVMCELLGTKYTGIAERLWKTLEKHNGTAVSFFTGDEHLHGHDNNHGTELCGIVEMMYSCEILYAVTGKRIWADRLERAAFNALPATISDDMWTHQYDQLVNQVFCTAFHGQTVFTTNGRRSNLFGLEPNYGCCTANHGQGWPKLAMSTFLRVRGGIECAQLLPMTLNTRLYGANVCVDIDTQYPFRHSAKITVTTDRPVKFKLKVRLPKWIKSLSVNGKHADACDYFTKTAKWSGKTEITLAFTDTPHFIKRFDNQYAVEYGALVYSLPIDAEWIMKEYVENGVERKFPYCDYELVPKSDWAFGFADKALTVCKNALTDVPFSSKNPPISITATLSPIKWGLAYGFDNVVAKKPKSSKSIGGIQEKTLIPYGCAKLRMTEMPFVKLSKWK